MATGCMTNIYDFYLKSNVKWGISRNASTIGNANDWSIQLKFTVAWKPTRVCPKSQKKKRFLIDDTLYETYTIKIDLKHKQFDQFYWSEFNTVYLAPRVLQLFVLYQFASQLYIRLSKPSKSPEIVHKFALRFFTANVAHLDPTEKKRFAKQSRNEIIADNGYYYNSD